MNPAPRNNPESPVALSAEDDDRLLGRVLARRDVLALTGGLGAAALMAACTAGATLPIASAIARSSASAAASSAASAASSASTGPATIASMPSCVATPAVTQGPYFVEEKLNRSDIRTDTTSGTSRDGAPLVLSFVISRVTGRACTTWEGTVVDVWHCDAVGQYSDVSDRGFNTVGQNWLRGYQTTDASGVASFTTIYPGWYSGRAVHIHFKVRTSPGSISGLEFTSQLFFDDAQSAAVYTAAPYATHGGTPDTPTARDSIYQQTGGQTLLTVAQAAEGYAASIGIGIKASAAARLDSLPRPTRQGPGWLILKATSWVWPRSEAGTPTSVSAARGRRSGGSWHASRTTACAWIRFEGPSMRGRGC